jgi:hypothetical protein
MRQLRADLVFAFVAEELPKQTLPVKSAAVNLRDLMLSAGQPAPPLTNIRKWKRRNSIPAYWVGAVLWSCACLAIDPLSLIEEME